MCVYICIHTRFYCEWWFFWFGVFFDLRFFFGLGFFPSNDTFGGAPNLQRYYLLFLVKAPKSRRSHLNETCSHVLLVCCVLCFILPRVLPAFWGTMWGIDTSSQGDDEARAERDQPPFPGDTERCWVRAGQCSSLELYPYSAVLKKLSGVEMSSSY